MTDDVEMQYANNPVIKGSEVRQMFKTVLGQLDMMTHEIRYFDFVAPRIYQAATIRYLVKGGNKDIDEITIPGFAVFAVRRDDTGRLKVYRAETFLALETRPQYFNESLGNKVYRLHCQD
ncbi:hypothetical protein N7466_010704 [Penicillium verhagenii]|uniref:uncharacterized protein n=1 Tax=Penicillium verhagenii TaxID=1562060 RepID=UPI00254523FC|nr:uncharacterized protein N7466_010704 [Penicillium verhagenii]KAJ5917150.1 hypothetical protein N7466_010704 [Penicillium verhagenii]